LPADSRCQDLGPSFPARGTHGGAARPGWRGERLRMGHGRGVSPPSAPGRPPGLGSVWLPHLRPEPFTGGHL